ncbi:MAG: serine hydrolase [Chitinophagaceae bacterium]|nr:serine hydrolase [Chitinophagaceae bacterium]
MKSKKLIFAGLLLIVNQAFSQNTQTGRQIKQVENNLIPFVPVKGFKGWNIIDRLKYYNVPGVSIAVIKDYKIAWAKGYGLADTTKKIPVTTETMFSAGSISKLVSAVTALKLVQNNSLQLDNPVNGYLTSWKIADNDITKKTPITLRMLLSHTAGTSQTSYFGFSPDKKPLPTIVEILSGAEIAESRPVVVNSEPKTVFRYSGGGSIIAQMAMMDVSKQGFADLTQQTIFDKLGMKNTTFEQPLPLKYLSQASGAYSSASWFKGMPYIYPQQAAAGLYTTPTDLAKFFIDLQKSYLGKGTILNQYLTKQMFTSQANVSDGSYKEQIGVGPFLIQRTDNKESKGVYFEFTGVNAGFLAYGMASVEGGNGVIIMLNSGDDVNGLGKEIRRAVAKTYNWYNFLPTEINPIKLDNSTLENYEGRFRKAADEVVVIKRENDYLVEKINNGGNIYCFPIAKDTVVFTDYNIKGFFAKNERGEIVSLRTEYQTVEQAWVRMKDTEFTPSEYLKAKKYKEAKEGFKQMNMNEYQITYSAYDLLNKKPADFEAVKIVLELAKEQHPNSSIVYSRWGDYYQKINDKTNAIKNYQKALELDPGDKQTKEVLEGLTK